MDEFVDYRHKIKTSGNSSACFLMCHTQGKDRIFFYMVEKDSSMLGHVTKTKQLDKDTLGLEISNFYDNWKTYLVPAWLTYYKIEESELHRYNGGKQVYLNSV